MLIWLVVGFIGVRPPAGQPWNKFSVGGSLLVFVLIALLGWKCFGPALHN
jgi:hypothetical protein